MAKESTRPSLKIVPSSKIVVIEPTKVSSSTDIIQAVTEKSIPEIGRVVAIGDGKLPVKMKVGDIIAYRKYGESKFYLHSKVVLFVTFEDILGVINE